jgi:hypothetical protein
MVFDRIAERVPIGLARTTSIAAVVAGLAGAVLIALAVAYGDWWLVAGAAAAFVVSGSLWQVADRLADRRQH